MQQTSISRIFEFPCELPRKFSRLSPSSDRGPLGGDVAVESYAKLVASLQPQDQLRLGDNLRAKGVIL